MMLRPLGSLALFFAPIAILASDENLGRLSEKYESGGRGPSTVSTGRGDPGGVSYGTYQLASKIGRADAFVKRYYPDEFKGLQGGTPEFSVKWKELAARDTAGLRKNEHEYIKETHYDPQVARLEAELKLNLATRSAALRDVVWSVAVQHGPRTDLIVSSVKPLLAKAAIGEISDEEIIRAVYTERGRKDENGKLVRFKSVGEEIIPAISRRMENEMKDALDMLNKQQSRAAQEKAHQKRSPNR